ncbi:uncharacterized protein [Primulina eburnea]|uniref:uncharacterized protein n=1 Tax=Primulina eburnea TaxID=1245227 RepID=UPI003C6C99FF
MAVNIGFNDPLYIHPSDTPGMSLITHHLIGTDNYGIWSRAMLIALRAKNKTGFIDGTCQRPAFDHPTLHQWERCNALVLSWIMNSVSKEIFGGIVYAVDTSSVWTDLKEQYDKINGSRIFSLHRDIGRLTQAGNTISSYYCNLKQLWDEYSSLVVLPSCECATARQYIAHDQQQKLLQFLMGLNESYTPLRSQILMMRPLPSVEASLLPTTDVAADKTTTVPSIFTPAQYAEILKLLGTHKDHSPAEPVNNMAGISDKLNSSSHWIIDSGSTEHMVGDSNMLQNYGSVATSSKFVRLPNNTKARVHKMGSVLLTNSINLTNDLKTGRLMGIVDEFSKATWVYLMQFKVDVLQLLKNFFQLVKTQFSTLVKIVRTDNASDFFKSECTLLFNSLGIVHQSSCPYTPQQNGVVERKHRHILDIARALRFQSSLPLKFWGDCVFTACYLINRTPTGLLKNKTPHELLFHKLPSYCHLRVFGCLCYATTLTLKDKFSARASACVFLGYSNTQKGYKVMNLDTRKFLVSRDVVFHESIFPFVSPIHYQPVFPPYTAPEFSSIQSDFVLDHSPIPPPTTQSPTLSESSHILPAS